MSWVAPMKMTVVQEMTFKDISIFSSGGHFVPEEQNCLWILIEGNMKNISVNIFWRPEVQDMSFEDISFF